MDAPKDLRVPDGIDRRLPNQSRPDSSPSANLSWWEMGCHDGTPYPWDWRSDRAVVLAQAFEAIRLEYGAPIRILSAYRTEAHNRAVGGSKASQHVQGRALDLAPVGRKGIAKLHAAIEQVARRTGSSIRGIGVYPSFVHIDTRPGDRIARWTGGRPKADVA